MDLYIALVIHRRKKGSDSIKNTKIFSFKDEYKYV